MRKVLAGLIGVLGLLPVSAIANPACVVCTVAIGATLSVARALGVDDCVVGVWAGAMLAILGYWTIRFFDKRKWFWPGRDFMLMALSIAMIGFMYMGELSYKPMVVAYIFYLDAFLFATIAGALTFICAMNFYEWMKAKNGGHAHFPFEKVVVPVGTVALLSLMYHYFDLCDCGADMMSVL